MYGVKWWLCNVFAALLGAMMIRWMGVKKIKVVLAALVVLILALALPHKPLLAFSVGIAPCTAMVLVWGYLSRGNDGLTLVMVAINSLTMLVLYGVLGGFLLGVGRLPVPWQALLRSIGNYVVFLQVRPLPRWWVS